MPNGHIAGIGAVADKKLGDAMRACDTARLESITLEAQIACNAPYCDENTQRKAIAMRNECLKVRMQIETALRHLGMARNAYAALQAIERPEGY